MEPEIRAAFESEVKQWAEEQKRLLKENVRFLTNNGKRTYLRASRKSKLQKAVKNSKHKSLATSISMKLRKRFDIPERIIFPFERHGAFIHFGVSREHPRSNPRQKINWFDPVLDFAEEKLADIAMKYYGNDAEIKLSRLGKP